MFRLTQFLPFAFAFQIHGFYAGYFIEHSRPLGNINHKIIEEMLQKIYNEKKLENFHSVISIPWVYSG
jgi:hypothetical protein